MRFLSILLLFTALVGLPACASTPHPKAQFQSLVKELNRGQGVQGTSSDSRKDLEKRFAKAEGWSQKGQLKSAEDKLWAAAILIHADSPERITLALQLARESAEAGEIRALPLVAQAMDKQALQNGRPQPYGTQYLFHTDPGIWVLYNIDPMTTDDERAEMGLPPLNELYSKVKILNQQHQERIMASMSDR